MSWLQCHIELNCPDKMYDMSYQSQQAVVSKVGLFVQAIGRARHTHTCKSERIFEVF